jgi:hypothetical protein
MDGFSAAHKGNVGRRRKRFTEWWPDAHLAGQGHDGVRESNGQSRRRRSTGWNGRRVRSQGQTDHGASGRWHLVEGRFIATPTGDPHVSRALSHRVSQGGHAANDQHPPPVRRALEFTLHGCLIPCVPGVNRWRRGGDSGKMNGCGFGPHGYDCHRRGRSPDSDRSAITCHTCENRCRGVDWSIPMVRRIGSERLN